MDNTNLFDIMANALNPKLIKELQYKFNIGDKVIYQGLIATIETRDTYAISGLPCYSIVSDLDKELTCTAPETECEAYDGQDVDQLPALAEAAYSSQRIAAIADSVTDKHIGDCSF